MPSRRRLLAASALALVGGAGCTGDSTVIGATDSDAAATDSGTVEDDGTESADTSEGGGNVLFTVSDGDEEVELTTYGDVATVGDIERSRHTGGYQLRVTLTDEGAAAFADALDAIGAFEDPKVHEIRTYLDGDVIYTATLGPDLAAAIEDGDWGGEMLMQFDDRKTGGEMQAALGGA